MLTMHKSPYQSTSSLSAMLATLVLSCHMLFEPHAQGSDCDVSVQAHEQYKDPTQTSTNAQDLDILPDRASFAEPGRALSYQNSSATDAGIHRYYQSQTSTATELDSRHNLEYGQDSSTAEAGNEAAYMYSSDTSLPSQNGALQWSIGGIPLQQQLRWASLFL